MGGSSLALLPPVAMYRPPHPRTRTRKTTTTRVLIGTTSVPESLSEPHPPPLPPPPPPPPPVLQRLPRRVVMTRTFPSVIVVLLSLFPRALNPFPALATRCAD